MANIALNKPSGGQLILSPEDGTSTETVTIPSVGVGKVLQVVTYTKHGQVANSSDTNIATGLAVTITPKSTTSKLIVTYKASIDTQGGGRAFSSALFRDGNVVIDEQGGGESRMTFSYSSGRLIETAHATFAEDAGSTSSTTYEVYFRSHNNVLGYFGYASTPQTITVMEVAA